MAIANSAFVDGNVISASDVKTRLQNAEDWVNGGIIDGDTSETGWVKNEHIYGPEFFGAPTPRAVFTTGQTHWRLTQDDKTTADVFHEEMRGAFVPVEGLNATIKLERASNVVVMASWWAWETGNKNDGYLSGSFNDGDNDKIGEFALFHVKHTNDGTKPTATRVHQTTRPLYFSHRSIEGWSRYGAKQMTVHRCISNLPAGIHTIGIRCNISGPTGGGDHEHSSHTKAASMNVFVRNRHLIVDAYPRTSASTTMNINATATVP